MADKVDPEIAARLMEPSSTEKDAGGLPPEKGLEILGADPEVMTVKAKKETFVKGESPYEEVALCIGPMDMDHCADFIVAAEKFMPLLMGQLKDNTSGNAVDFNVTALMRLDKEAFFKCVAIASDCKPELVKRLMPDDFLKVVTKVFVVNLDFFVRTLPQAFGLSEASIVIGLQKLLNTGGQLVSKNLSQKATA